ncbi:MAG: nucleotide exchange factor GrpE [Acidimicrobiales bacterium]
MTDNAVTNGQVDNDEVGADGVVEAKSAEPTDPLSQLERERDDYLDSLQRLQADFENYRKRVARTSEESAVRAAGVLVVKLLPVLDVLDLAQAHFAGEANEEAAALEQSRSLLLDTLEKEGLERIDEVGAPFDPQVHDAVAHVPGDEGEADQVVDDVLRAGYRWKGAVLRPAMVRVKG